MTSPFTDLIPASGRGQAEQNPFEDLVPYRHEPVVVTSPETAPVMRMPPAVVTPPVMGRTPFGPAAAPPMATRGLPRLSALTDMRMPQVQPPAREFHVTPPTQPDELAEPRPAVPGRTGGIAPPNYSFSSRLANALAGIAMHPEQIVQAPLEAAGTLRDFVTQKALGAIADPQERAIIEGSLPNPSTRDAVNAGAQLASIYVGGRAGSALTEALAPAAMEGGALTPGMMARGVAARAAGRATAGGIIGTTYAPTDPGVGAAVGAGLGLAEALGEGKGTVRRIQSPYTDPADVTRQIGTAPPQPRPRPQVSVTGRVLDAPNYPPEADFEVHDEPTAAALASVGVEPKGFGARPPKPTGEAPPPVAATPAIVAQEPHPTSDLAREQVRPAPEDMAIPAGLAPQRPVEAPAPAQAPSVAPTVARQPERQAAPAANPFADLVEKPKHEFSSTQLDLPAETSAAIKQLGAGIPDEHLAEDGREENPHITVKYGLHADHPEDLRALLADEGPIPVTLGKTSIFPNGESNSGDVVKVDVDSPELHRLNKKIADALPHTDTHPEYKPHATIAYVKPGLGEQYAGDESLAGHSVTVDRLTFSDKNGQKVEIPLNGAPLSASASDEVPEHESPFEDLVPDEKGSTSSTSSEVAKEETPLRGVDELNRLIDDAQARYKNAKSPAEKRQARDDIADFRIERGKAVSNAYVQAPVAQPEATPQTIGEEATNAARPVRESVSGESGGEPTRGVPTPRAERATPEASGGSRPPRERAVREPRVGADETASGPGGIDRAGAAPERAGEPGEGVSAGRGTSEAEGARGGEQPATGPEPRAARPRERSSAPQGKNYQLTDADAIGAGGPKAKAAANIAAIQTLKQIEAEGRPATPEEQQTLARYTGWGGISQVFEPGHKDFGAFGKELEQHLTREEYEAARASTLNAHFTHPEIVKQVHAALRTLGFTGGKILEPSAGVGNFLGFTPPDVAGQYHWTAVELDAITGRIAKLLYPEADVRVHGFEKLKVPDGTYDAAVGNVPFGDYKLADKRYDKLKLSIHDYFFVKSLDLVRPGGIVAYITSRYTMDRADPRVRNAILERGDLVGAVRLPTGAFRGNAGTDVVTDLIILRKKGAGDPSQVQPSDAWQKVVNVPISGIGTNINKYWTDHPDMVIGTAKLGRGMYGPNEYEVHAPKDLDVAKALGERVAKLPAAYVPPTIDVPATRGQAQIPELKVAPDNMRDGSFVAEKDGIYRVENGQQVKASVPKAQEPIVRKLVAIRDQYKEVMRTQLEDADEQTITKAREKLNSLYDGFVKEHGPINLEKSIETSRKNEQGQPIVQTRRPNLSAFMEDPEWPLVASLERYDPETGTASKMDALTRRMLGARTRVEKADTPADALPIVLAESGKVDLARIAQLSGATPEDTRAALRGAIYEDPEAQGTYRTATQYLSGNVRQKLKLAEQAAKKDPTRWAENVKALKENQPEDLPPSKISAKLGAPWIPKEDLKRFISETFGAGDVDIFHLPSEAIWKVKADWRMHSSFAATEEYGTRRAPGPELLEDALNLKTPWVYDRVPDGNGGTTSVKNIDESLAAQEKQQKLKDRFAQWVWEDSGRADRLSRLYNDQFNNTRIPVFDGRHLTMPGAATHVNGREFKLAKHQLDAIWRVLENGNTLLAHVVGGGKTYTMVAAGMEAKRMGLARKPLYVVPNHMLEQFSREFMQLYPTAKILVASRDDFAKERRKEFVARAASHEWDGIIMTHRSHEAIAMSPDFQQQYLREEMNALEDSLREAKKAREQTLVKMVEKAKKRREDKLVKLMAESKKDDLLTFEQLGADMLFIDEAHLFKNLEFRTKLEGVSAPGSERAFDLYLKTKYLDQQNPGRNIVFATGTPISNAIAEIYTMQRYLQPRMLAERGISQFDDWAATFGEPVTAMELAPDGSGYRAKTRFAKYQNVGELAQMFRSVADVKTTEDLNLPRPKLKGGQMEMVSARTTGPLKAYVAGLVRRAQLVKEKKVDPSEDNFLRITTDGRHAALDMRLVDATAVDEPHSKVNQAIDRIHAIWERTKKLRGAQLVFSDLSAPGSDPSRVRGGVKDFNVYDDVRQKLIARGIPAKEIRFMHEADTPEKKGRLFADVRAGRVRVLIGSTEKMGAGTNVQDKLVALHHLDAPWRPSDIEQRNGRILRQGNQLYNEQKIPDVEINAYVTEGSFDAYIWQTLERKAEFIRQAMTADASTREMEDIGTVEVDFATAKAIASGNPKVKEKADIDVQVQRLERLERQHRDEQLAVARELKNLPAQVDALRKEVKALEADTQRTEDTSGDKFKVTLNGTTMGERAAAGESLKAAIGKAAVDANPLKAGEERDTRLGTFAGFDLAVVGRRTMTGSIETWLKLIGDDNHYREVSPNDSAASLVAQLESMPRLIGKLEEAKSDKLQAAQQRLTKLEEKGLSKFKDAEKLADLKKRQAALSKELEDDAKTAEEQARHARSEPIGSMTDLHSFVDPISAAIKMWKQANALRKARLGLATTGVAVPPLNAASASVGAHRAAVQYVFNPAARSDQAARMARIKREALGELALRNERAHQAIEQLRESIEKLPAHIDPKVKDFKGPRWQWAFRMERGQAQPTPAQMDAARVIRDLLDSARGDVQKYGKLQTWIEDYFPHIWSDPKKALSFVQRMLGRRPLEGPKSFLKQRSIDELEDGIDAGLTPISENPLDMVLLKLREMHKYIAAQKIFREGRKAGLLKFVRPSKKLPTGWKYIEDPMATVYAQRGSQGEIRIRGRYAAPEPVARIINGYLAPGLRGNALYDSYMHVGNMMNLVQLGLGAFHLGFVAFDATISLGALGLEELGTPGRRTLGARHLTEAAVSAALGPLTAIPVTAPVMTYLKGRQVHDAYMQGAQTPEMQQIIDGLVSGGGRVKMDSFYKLGFAAQFRDALKDKRWAETAFAAPFAAIEQLMKPLLEHVVPRMKLGAFMMLWQHELAKLPSGSTKDDVRKAAAKAWDSIDNRLGQLVYDNLDWHRVTKDILMASVRSVGWNVGTFREIGGGVNDALHGRGGHKVAYIAALAALVAVYGAIYTYLHTGDLPGHNGEKYKGLGYALKDLYLPRTGTQDPQGNDERVSPPTYVKDVVSFGRHPVTTITNKMHPLLSLIGSMIQNKDFFGDEIYNPHDPLLVKAGQIAQAIEREARPFSVQNVTEQSRRGQSLGTMAQSLVGISPAPRELVRSPAEQLMAEYLGEKGGGRTPEAKETSDKRRELRDAVKAQATRGPVDIGQLIRSGELTKRQAIESVKEAHKPSLVNRFQRLTIEQAIDVYRVADPDQRKQLKPYLQLKRASALRNGVPADRVQIPQ